MTMDEVRELFAFQHLPDGTPVKATSETFHNFAVVMVGTLPPSAERTLMLRKLWEAKNLAVYAKVQEARHGE